MYCIQTYPFILRAQTHHYRVYIFLPAYAEARFFQPVIKTQGNNPIIIIGLKLIRPVFTLERGRAIGEAKGALNMSLWIGLVSRFIITLMEPVKAKPFHFLRIPFTVYDSTSCIWLWLLIKSTEANKNLRTNQWRRLSSLFCLVSSYRLRLQHYDAFNLWICEAQWARYSARWELICHSMD